MFEKFGGRQNRQKTPPSEPPSDLKSELGEFGIDTNVLKKCLVKFGIDTDVLEKCTDPEILKKFFLRISKIIETNNQLGKKIPNDKLKLLRVTLSFLNKRIENISDKKTRSRTNQKESISPRIVNSKRFSSIEEKFSLIEKFGIPLQALQSEDLTILSRIFRRLKELNPDTLKLSDDSKKLREEVLSYLKLKIKHINGNEDTYLTSCS